MLRTFLLVCCVPAYVVCENYSAQAISDRIYEQRSSESEPCSRLDSPGCIPAIVFLVPESSESVNENATLFLECDVLKWVHDSFDVDSSWLTRDERKSNLKKLFKNISQFSTENENNNVTCLILRNASSAWTPVFLVPALENSTSLLTNITCLIRPEQKIHEAALSKNTTHFNFEKLLQYPVDHSEGLNVSSEGRRYTCLVIYEDDTVLSPDDGDTTTILYDRSFRITVPDELANELEEAIASDVRISFIFAVIILSVLVLIVVWITYLLFFVTLPKVLRHYGYHCCCGRRHQRPKKEKN